MITILLVALNLLAYTAELSGGPAGGLVVCAHWGLVPAHPTAATVLTSMFLHDPGTIWHLGGNMACLVLFGIAVERVIGPVRFAALYLAAGIGGALTHVLVNPSAVDPLVGASGAIFGVLAAAALLYPRCVGFVASYAAFNIVLMLLGAGGTVAVADHVGGFAVGYFAMRFVFARQFNEFRFAV